MTLNVILDETTGTIPLTGDAPLTLTLNPSGYSIGDGPIIKIEYNFDSISEPIIVTRKINPIVSPEVLATYAYPTDPGDPRNILVTHTYHPSISTNPHEFTLSVKITKGRIFTPVEYIIPVQVYKISAITGIYPGYFEDIHLINSRISGTDNKKIYALETVDPRYVTFITYTDS